MKKNKLLYILLAFLVLMNGFFLFQHFKSIRQDRSVGDRHSHFIAKQLNFDAEQLQEFKAMDKAHRSKIHSLVDNIRVSKETLFNKLYTDTVDDSELEAITDQIAKNEKAKDLETFRFFKALGEMCNEDQKKRFKSIVEDALHRNGRRNKKGLSRPRDQHRPPPLKY